ncbi:uncharacterized protein Z518_00431 [Rhinocladiella mackenziei CBS 650.93]|uniref:Xylanolytic transcriptional activator regulatory domain-containing protein n=1 Tax=Rhinocladiella mackenziei CBS 650.93 TaxID=1442369 RepID=A0A0D2G3Y3_9EURO|nr:uncharacterized protein Z518_00431 [Rhinocladiella mackenziei CBS 650.93]KIX09352.1 hypothetical protein Z518_00431 [Rhinocladiella mackenziei CBS 650.93]
MHAPVKEHTIDEGNGQYSEKADKKYNTSSQHSQNMAAHRRVCVFSPSQGSDYSDDAQQKEDDANVVYLLDFSDDGILTPRLRWWRPIGQEDQGCRVEVVELAATPQAHTGETASCHRSVDNRQDAIDKSEMPLCKDDFHGSRNHRITSSWPLVTQPSNTGSNILAVDGAHVVLPQSPPTQQFPCTTDGGGSVPTAHTQIETRRVAQRNSPRSGDIVPSSLTRQIQESYPCQEHDARIPTDGAAEAAETLEYTQSITLVQQSAHRNERQDIALQPLGLSLPEATFRDVCLCRYAEFVYPVLPLLDLEDFLGELNSGGRGVSLLLLSAVVYAAVAFVEVEHVKDAGYSSKMAARKTLYEKAKLLFDLRAEDSKVVMVQAALLLSTPHGDMDDRKDAWYWVGTATALAQSLGLHLERLSRGGDGRKNCLRRRLWWCCYIREHVVAMGMGRPCRMSHYNVTMISIADCDIAPLPDSSPLARFFPPESRQTTARLRLATLFIEKARICICMHKIVAAVYAADVSHGDEESLDAIDSGQPTKSNKIEECIRELELWVKMLPTEAAYKGGPVSAIQDDDRCLVVSRIMLWSIYYWSIITLHRPCAFGNISSANRAQQPVGQSRLLVRWAAQQVTSVQQFLHDQLLNGYLDATAVAILIGAIVVHMQDCRVEHHTVQRHALHDLRRCMSFL